MQLLKNNVVRSRASSVRSGGSVHHKITTVDFEQFDMTKSGKIVFETVPYRWAIILVFSGLVVNVAWATVGFSSYVG